MDIINYICLGALVLPLLFGGFLLYSRMALASVNRNVLNYGNFFINLISFILFSVSAYLIFGENTEFEYNLSNLYLNGFEFNFGFLISKTNLLFLSLCSLVFVFISLYSKFYFDKKKQFIFTKQRYYIFLSLLAFNTYVFLVSVNLFQSLIFWIIQGVLIFVFSYFDIFKNAANFNITRFNRITLIGDFAFLISIFILFKYSCQADIENLSLNISTIQDVFNQIYSICPDIELKICVACFIVACSTKLILFPFSCYYSFFANSSNIFYICVSSVANSVLGLYILYLTQPFLDYLEYSKIIAVFLIISSSISLISIIFERNIKIIFGYLISAVNGIFLIGYIIFDKLFSTAVYLVFSFLILFALMLFFYNDKINIRSRFFTKQKGFMLERAHIFVFEVLPEKIFQLLNFIDEFIVQNFFLFFINILNLFVSIFVIKTKKHEKYKYIRNILLIFAIMLIVAIFVALFGSGRFNAELIR